MAGSTTARRRLSLLAGGSLAAVTLATTTSVALLSPTQARAANECGGNPATNGATADTFDCTGSQAAIGYATSGALTLRMNNGVATTTGGVVVTSSGADAVTISRVDSPADAGDPSLASTSGAGISVISSGTGAITVNLSDTDAGDTPLVVSGTTFGVKLSGGGTATAVSLTTTNGQITATGGIGVQAISNSTAAGNIALTLGGGVAGTTGAIQTSIAGTGTQTITLSAQSASVAGGAVTATSGPAIQVIAGSGAGAATVVVGGARTVAGSTSAAVIDINNANGARTITNNGTIRSSDATAGGYDDLAVAVGAGAGAVTLNNTTLTTTNTATSALYATANLNGRLSLLNSGAATITNGAAARVGGGSVWHTAGTSLLGGGATTLNNNANTVTVSGVATPVRAVIATNAGGAATTLDFGGGTDTFTNAGILAVGEGTEGAATLTLTSLEAWNNSGLVLFGADGAFTASDGVANDRIVVATTFTGSGTSTLVMDVNFTGAQANCAAAVTADCLDLRGGTTGGSTAIVVNPVGAGRALAGRIVLVDVGGGFSADDRFVLSSTSANYALGADGQAVIDAGILHYALLYDTTTQQHFLLGTPDIEAFEPGVFSSFARGAWDLVTGTWFDRGVDVRGAGPGAGHGAWLRIVGSNTDYTVSQSFTSGGVRTDYDTGYEQQSAALVGGLDLITAGGEGGAWVFGVTAGQVDSDTSFMASPSTVSLKGYALGAYSSFMSGPVFIDAIVNAAKLDLTYDAPGQGVTIDNGQATSIGFQLEGGYQLAVPDMPAHIEPLVALSYVRTELDDLAMPDVDVAFENTGSLRAGLGLRISGDGEMGDWSTRFAFTGRVWEEFNGESEVALTNAALDLPLTYDDPNDRLGEVGFTVNARGPGDHLSLQAGVRFQFKAGYESRELGLAARYVW